MVTVSLKLHARQGLAIKKAQVLKTRRVDGIGIAIARKVQRTVPAEEDTFFYLAHQHRAASRRLKRGRQQTMIAPGIGPNDAGSRKTTDAIG